MDSVHNELTPVIRRLLQLAGVRHQLPQNRAPSGNSGQPGANPSSRHEDGGNVEVLLWDVHPWDDDHYYWGE